MQFTESELTLLKWALKEIIPWLETDEDFTDLDSVWGKLGFEPEGKE